MKSGRPTIGYLWTSSNKINDTKQEPTFPILACAASCSYDVIMKHALAKNHVNTLSRAYRKTKNNMPRWQLPLYPLDIYPIPREGGTPTFEGQMSAKDKRTIN